MAGHIHNQHGEKQENTHATSAMKKHYKRDNNVRPTAPLHNLKLQIERLEWSISPQTTIVPSLFTKQLIKNTINELKSVLTQLSNPSKAFTIWTHPETVHEIKPDFMHFKRTPFLQLNNKAYYIQ